MAKAPRPGSTPNSNETKKREHDRHLVYRIKVRDEELTLRHADLGPADAALVRRETGMTLRSVLGTALDSAASDFDVFAVVWWLAKVKAGEDISYAVAVGKFPSYAEIEQVKFTIDVEGGSEEDPDSPEA